MALSTRITPINRDIALIIANDLTPDAASKALAEFARGALTDAQETNRQALGRIPPHETFVDGRQGAPLESVKPLGAITFEFELLDDVFAWIGEQLVLHSPVLTGRFRASHAFFADGVEVEPGAPLPQAREYVFINTQPYARKIERGLSPQAPDGVYEAVATLAARRFGNVAQIRFGYRVPLGGGIHEWAGTTRVTGKGRSMSSRTRAEWLRRQPAIVITVR